MGGLKTTPWSLAPIASETVPLLDNLREINARGLVTTEGQPGDCNEYKMDGTSYTDYQRGYMNGIIKKSMVLSLARNLPAGVLLVEHGDIKETIEYNEFNNTALTFSQLYREYFRDKKIPIRDNS